MAEATTCGKCWAKFGVQPAIARTGQTRQTMPPSKARYPDLHKAGGMLRSYGLGLRALCVIGLLVASGAIGYGAAWTKTEADAQTAYAFGFSAIEWSIAAFILGVLFSALGQACIALADLATSSAETAESLRQPPTSEAKTATGE